MPTETDAIPPPDGALDAFMTRMLGRSWRTQLAGLASLACGIVTGIGVASPGVLPPILVAIAAAASPSLAGLGLLVAKDAKVSGLPK